LLDERVRWPEGVGWATVYDRRLHGAQFASQWAEIVDETVEVMEGEVRGRDGEGPLVGAGLGRPFLQAFRETGMVTEARRVAGVSRAAAYGRRRSDESFVVAWHDAELDVVALLEDEAVRRALHVVARPVSPLDQGRNVPGIRARGVGRGPRAIS